MKKIIVIAFLVCSSILWGQTKAHYVKTIFAVELSNGDTINKKELVTYYDSLRNVISSENNFENAVSGDDSGKNTKKSKATSFVEVDTDSLYIKVDINSEGDTIGKLIYMYDENGNRTHYFQVLRGDTVNAQKRVHDKWGNSIELYNRSKINNKYYLAIEWEYDNKGNLVKKKSYNEKNMLIGLDKYKNKYKKNGKEIIVKSSYKNGKGFVKQYKTVSQNNTQRTDFYYTRTFFNYGIKLEHKGGGFKISEYDENDNLQKMELYDDKKNLIAFVEITEKELEK